MKYGKIIAERKEFHENEPVFVLRSTDTLAPYAVEFYANVARAAATGIEVGGDDPEPLRMLAEECDNIAAAMRVWQSANAMLVALPD